MLIVSKDLKSIIMSSVNKGSILVSFSLLNMGHISFMGAIADYGVLNPNHNPIRHPKLNPNRSLKPGVVFRFEVTIRPVTGLWVIRPVTG